MEKNKIIEAKEENIEIYDKYKITNMIYTIRGMQVMLDNDVAMLYHTETKRINQAVKRNIERFPERFCFQLKENEIPNRWSQIVTTSENQNNKYRRKKYLPNAFTEQGIAMLSSLLKSDIAIQVSINIMDAFFEMRKFIANNSNMLNRLTTVEYKLLEHDKKFNDVFNELQKKEEEPINSKIFYNGQIYDSYNLIIKIIKRANKKILIIDNYIDDSILKMLTKKKKNVEVVIFTSNNCTLTKLDIKKFNEQYSTLKIAKTSIFHDRFVVIDDVELYHLGASLKDLGKKCFAINKMEDMKFIENIEKDILFL